MGQAHRRQDTREDAADGKQRVHVAEHPQLHRYALLHRLDRQHRHVLIERLCCFRERSNELFGHYCGPSDHGQTAFDAIAAQGDIESGLFAIQAAGVRS